MASDPPSSQPSSHETISPTLKPLQLSLRLPESPQTTIHIHLTILTTTLLLFLTTTSPTSASAGALSSLGSFVYAMPDRLQASNTLSTALYTRDSSVDFTTRVAKILARRTGMPVYVGGSVDFGMGATIEEEVEGLKGVIDVVVAEVGKTKEEKEREGGL
ncbi:MAG: hypothetical protein M1830_000464 [Pleopsidium flavum]|nr:MAG: hypothetical protein M1830_000464 [Pleopsidium flavum]